MVPYPHRPLYYRVIEISTYKNCKNLNINKKFKTENKMEPEVHIWLSQRHHLIFMFPFYSIDSKTKVELDVPQLI